MKTLKQYLIGKKKVAPLSICSMLGIDEQGYNKALDDILSDLPQLEKELMGEIGSPVERGFDLNAMSRGGSPVTIETKNKERERVRTIIHNFFNN